MLFLQAFPKPVEAPLQLQEQAALQEPPAFQEVPLPGAGATVPQPVQVGLVAHSLSTALPLVRGPGPMRAAGAGLARITPAESHSQRPEEGGVDAEEIENAPEELQHEQEISQREHTVRTVRAVRPSRGPRPPLQPLYRLSVTTLRSRG